MDARADRSPLVDLGLERVLAETMAVNEASRATMAAVGMTSVRTFHPGFDEPIEGSELGGVEHAITREQWLTGTREPSGWADLDGVSPVSRAGAP